MSNIAELSALREQLLAAATRAREAEHGAPFARERKEVENILEKLRALYARDAAPFDQEFLRDIRIAKICVRIITRVDLDREEAENARQAILAAHESFVRKVGRPYRGAHAGLGKHRLTHCYSCGRDLD